MINLGIEKKVFSFRFDEEIVDRLKYYAKKQNRNFSNFVETILLDELEKLDSAEQNKTDEA